MYIFLFFATVIFKMFLVFFSLFAEGLVYQWMTSPTFLNQSQYKLCGKIFQTIETKWTQFKERQD